VSLAAIIEERLAAYVADGLLVGGGQAVVIERGVVRASVATGTDYLGRPMQPEHLTCVYCCSKLPLYTALLALMEAGLAQLNTPLRALLPEANEFVGSCEIAQMLGQRGGFTMLDGPVSRFIPDQVRQLSPQWLEEPPARPRGTLAYSVSEVGWLTALILERAGGRAYGDQVQIVLNDVLGPDAMAPQRGPLTVTYQRDADTELAVPLLNELSSAVRSQWNPSLGWYTSALGMARFGAALNDAWHGRRKLGQPIVRHAATPSHAPEFDAGMQMDMTYGLGYWTSLSEMGYGAAASPSSFGHGAQGSTSSLFIDPERELVVSLCFDLAIENDSAKKVRRGPLMDAIFAVIDA